MQDCVNWTTVCYMSLRRSPVSFTSFCSKADSVIMYSKMFCWIGLLLFSISCFTVHGGLIIRPTNTEVVVGQSVRLRCSTSDIYNVNWEHFPTGSVSKSYVFFGEEITIPYHRRFSVDRGSGNSGQYDLIISSVELSDSGRYRCIDREGQGEQSEAELVVLASQPQCYADEFIGENSCGVKNKEDILVHCSVLYTGNVVPSVKCPDLANHLIKSDVVLNPGNVSYILALKPDPKITYSPHTCYTSMSNITSNEFNFSVTYVAASPIQIEILESTQLTCTANSTTSCTYRWINEDGNVTSTDRTAEIDVPGMYRCEADCPIQGQICTVQCLEVYYVQLAVCYGGLSPLIVVIRIVSVLVTLLLITVVGGLPIVIVCLVRRKRQRRAMLKQLPMQNDISEKEEMLIKIYDASLRTAG